MNSVFSFICLICLPYTFIYLFLFIYLLFSAVRHPPSVSSFYRHPTMDWQQALYFFLLPSSPASQKMPRPTRLVHKAPVMQQSIPPAPRPPPPPLPPGYCGAFSRLVSPRGGAFANFAPPRGRAFANPRAIPEPLTRTRFPIRI